MDFRMIVRSMGLFAVTIHITNLYNSIMIRYFFIMLRPKIKTFTANMDDTDDFEINAAYISVTVNITI